MARPGKLLTSVVLVVGLLGISGMIAFAYEPSGPGMADAPGVLHSAPSAAWLPPAKECTKLEVADEQVLWFAVDEEHQVDTKKVLDEYPSGVTALAAGFKHNCIPKNTTLTIVWYTGGVDSEPLLTEKERLKPSNRPGIYYRLYTQDEEELPDGDYQVQFYYKKKLLAEGEVTVGGEPSPQPTPVPTRRAGVTVHGLIEDGSTGSPIQGAVFVVLRPGVTTADWAGYGYPPSDMLVTAKTNRQGKFSLRVPLERGQTYSVIAWALSYQGYYDDYFTIADDAPDRLEVTIQLYR